MSYLKIDLHHTLTEATLRSLMKAGMKAQRKRTLTKCRSVFRCIFPSRRNECFYLIPSKTTALPCTSIRVNKNLENVTRCQKKCSFLWISKRSSKKIHKRRSTALAHLFFVNWGFFLSARINKYLVPLVYNPLKRLGGGQKWSITSHLHLFRLKESGFTFT